MESTASIRFKSAGFEVERGLVAPLATLWNTIGHTTIPTCSLL